MPPNCKIVAKFLHEITMSQMFKKLPAFYETLSSITVFKNGDHLPYPEPDKSKPQPRNLFRCELF